MRYDEFYKLITLKMDVIGKAREDSYNKLHKVLEGMPPNDPALAETVKTVIETEKNLQDMMKVIDVVVNRQLEAYDSINTFAVELPKKRQEAKQMNGKQRVKFVDEAEDDEEAKDGTYTVEKHDDEDETNVTFSGSSSEKENKKNVPPPVLYMREMPISPVLVSAANNSLLSSCKKPASHFKMPITPPTTHKVVDQNKSRANLEKATPRMLDFDDTLM
uniref:Uncharacterized protein n=1 Tax=Panagrolaimus sp. ES5 TaxID=591445 RepID=A0AC34F1W8_9BILA